MMRVTRIATEEAIPNAMGATRTMTGRDGLAAHALPHDRRQEVLKKYGRWVDPTTREAATDISSLRTMP